MFVIGMIVDQERLEWLEEQPRGFTDARLIRLARSNGASQLRQDELRASEVVATQHGAFELCYQQSARSWSEIPEKKPQSFDSRLR
jgi:hypothetical protein